MESDITLHLNVIIRACRKDDLPKLEWFGLEAAYRDYVAEAFECHQTGQSVFLVAEANHFPIGKVWLDLALDANHSVAMVRGLTIIPCFQNLGLGTRLMKAAEDCALQRGIAVTRAKVGKDNPDALRLYQRLGYSVVGEDQARYADLAPNGEPVYHDEPVWIIERQLV